MGGKFTYPKMGSKTGLNHDHFCLLEAAQGLKADDLSALIREVDPPASSGVKLHCEA